MTDAIVEIIFEFTALIIIGFVVLCLIMPEQRQ